MATKLIEITDAAADGSFAFAVDLDGVTFQADFQYNSREGFWYFDLLDVNGDPLRSGIKVVANYPILRLYSSRSRPAGEILFIDSRPAAQDPDLDGLGTLAVMVYEEAASLVQ